jgi:hypothetical protein
MTHGGYGYAKEYHVERYMREVMISRIAPISPQLILCYIAEKVLGLPKSVLAVIPAARDASNEPGSTDARCCARTVFTQ